MELAQPDMNSKVWGQFLHQSCVTQSVLKDSILTVTNNYFCIHIVIGRDVGHTKTAVYISNM